MIDSLNERFALEGSLGFTTGRGGLPMARIKTDLCTGEIYLHGAHVTSWRPTDHEEVLWLSESSHFAADRAIRGGVPLCWPWFGDDPSGAGRPSHGFARTCSFAVTRTARTAGGDCVIELALAPTAATRKLSPEEFHLTLTATFGSELDLQLRMENRAPHAVDYTGALHTYLRVSDVERVGIAGLAGGDYLDKVRGFARAHQVEEPRVHGEVDRIYLQTAAPCCITDDGLDRTLRVAKDGSQTTVLWNPGPSRAREMADLDDAGYRHMLCIESANAADDVVRLAMDEHHVLGTTLSVAPGAHHLSS